MARRSDHSRGQLADLVLNAARALATEDGLRAVTMRSIAGRIGYAPGSIYNAVGDLDTVLLRLKADTLNRLADHLESVLGSTVRHDRMESLIVVAEAYLGFVADHARLWALLFEHRMPAGTPPVDWFEAARARPIAIMDGLLVPFFENPAARRRATTALWASLQGVAALSIAGTLTATDETADAVDIARSIVRRYLTGHE